MENSSPRIRSLLRQADKVTVSGKRLAAENLYRQILEEAPDTVPAWVGLAKVVQDAAEQEAALERALALDPDSSEAKIGLTAIRNGQSVAEALNPEPEPEQIGKSAPLSAAQPEPAAKAAYFETPARTAETAEGKGPVPTAVEPAAGAAAGAVAEASVESLEAAEQGLGEHVEGAVVKEEALYCINHPNKLTHLRCNKCGRPVCAKCVRPTPVGYRCKSCIREHEDAFYTATAVHYVIAAVVALLLGIVSGFIAGRLNFLVIFFAAFAGSVIARIVHRLIGRRRGRWMPFLVAGAVVVGGVIPFLPALLGFLFGDFGGTLNLVWTGIYIAIATSAAFYQMK